MKSLSVSRSALARCAALSASIMLVCSNVNASANQHEATRPTPRIVLFGFEPFGPFERNPTAELVHLLAAQGPAREALVLSVEPEAALGKLLPVFEQKPTLVIGFGVHIGVSHLQVNMSAINWLAMRSEADALYFGPIDPALPLEIRVAQPWAQEAIDRIAQTGIAYSTERDAGMHACNLALFHSIAHASASTRVIFFHVGPDILERPELLRDIARVVTALGPP